MTKTEMSVFDFEGHLTFNAAFSSSSVVSVSNTHGQVYVSIVTGLELKQYSSIDWKTPKTTKLSLKESDSSSKDSSASSSAEILAVSSHSPQVRFLATVGEEVVIGTAGDVIASSKASSSSASSASHIKITFSKKQILGMQMLFTETHLVLLERETASSSSKLHFVSLASSTARAAPASFEVPSTPLLQSQSTLKHVHGSHVAVNGVIFSSTGKIALSAASNAPASYSIASNDAVSTYCSSSDKCFLTVAEKDKIIVFSIAKDTKASSPFSFLASIPIATKAKSKGLIALAEPTEVRYASILVLETTTPRSGPAIEVVYLLQRKDWLLESGKSTSASGGRNELFWRRAESLASPLATLVVELPAQVHDSLMKDESGLGHLVRRWTVHVSETLDYVSSFLTDFDLAVLPSYFDALTSFNLAQLNTLLRGNGQRTETRKDEFGFAKLLIAVTRANSVICYNSLSRSLLWSSSLPSAASQVSKSTFSSLSVPISSLSFQDLQPKDLIIYQLDSEQGPVIQVIGHAHVGDSQKSFSISILALTGQLIDMKLFPIAYSSLIMPFKPQGSEKAAVLMVDEKTRLFIESSSLSILRNHAPLRFYIAHKETGAIVGFKADVAKTMKKMNEEKREGETKLIQVEVNETWQVMMGTSIDALVHNEVRTVSPGKVVGVDRSVLHKYLNPNAIAVVTTHTTDGEKGKTSNLQVTVIDTVTGNVIHRLVQRGAIGSPELLDANEEKLSNEESAATHPMRSKIVFYDDWIVFSYWSTRSNRFELMSLEMFESEANFVSESSESSNPTTSTTTSEPSSSSGSTSFSTQPNLNVKSQTFILMGSIRSLAATTTHLGISVQDLLIVYQDGKTSQISIKFLDPRRPIKAEDDPTLPPYNAYIPLDGQTIINYYSTIARVHHVKTSPSALESSSIVWLSGLDSFVRLIAQKGQSFDRLSHDYSFLQIGTICVALGLATYFLKSVSKRKELREKWK